MDEVEMKKNSQDQKVNGSRIWVFRVLVIAAAALLLVAWFLPWWNMAVEGFALRAVQIRPWGLTVSEKMATFQVLMKKAVLPGWFPVFMWSYLGLCLVALIVGMFVHGSKIRLGKFRISISQLLIGGVGFSYIIAGIVAAVYAGMRMKKAFDVVLQGRTFIDYGDPLTTYVRTSLQPGWYLIFVAGIALLLLGIFRDRISGENSTG